ncbi:MAG TPA: hypothetical protein EYP41_04905 [Anaerolineae bacterium]|nr:hypothetical protein [Anaerolineae bacterium]
MNPFPAVLIGGPPHSGKSVLVYSLSQALRAARISHYVLRITPDGEGDWSNEADQDLAQMIRLKGKYTASFTQKIEDYLRQRQLPLLVDAGGRPTLRQEMVFSHCTQAVLLAAYDPENPARYETAVAEWQAMMARQGIPVIARLKSSLQGTNQLESADPIVSGVLARLERGRTAAGPAFTALVEKLQTLFTYSEAALTRIYLGQAPVELTLDLPALARTLGSADGRWQPGQLPVLWQYLPTGKPLAAYGRAPNWIFAALARIAHPAPFWLFDARLGWLQPASLSWQPNSAGPVQPGWAASWHIQPESATLKLDTHGQMLDPSRPEELPLPPPPDLADRGVVISGKIPYWLLAGAVRLFPTAPWLGVCQVQHKKTVVIASQTPEKTVGEMIPAIF